MTWPISQDYNEAIQSPGSSFADPELRSGEPVTNAMGLPMPRSGNFADVYEFQGATSKWAVKCFTREIAGLQERYSEISKHLLQAKLPFAVDFKYLDQGIRIRGQWYPVLKMQWVEGQLLNEIVRNHLEKPNILEGLSQIWLRMAKRLREANAAHADLQHGNVILVPGSKAGLWAVRLIDYDGMWVPTLAQKKSGEVGHTNYQHPLRISRGTYSADVDRFPHLVIYTALRSLRFMGKDLWERYDNGDNLLFKQSDLAAPGKSPLFQELLKVPDAATLKMVQTLMRAAETPMEQTPHLDELVEIPGMPATAVKKATAVLTTPPAAPAARPITPPSAPQVAAPMAAQAPGGFDFAEVQAPAPAMKAMAPRPADKPAVPKGVWIGLGAGLVAVVGLLIAIFMFTGKPTPGPVAKGPIVETPRLKPPAAEVKPPAIIKPAPTPNNPPIAKVEPVTLPEMKPGTLFTLTRTNMEAGTQIPQLDLSRDGSKILFTPFGRKAVVRSLGDWTVVNSFSKSRAMLFSPDGELAVVHPDSQVPGTTLPFEVRDVNTSEIKATLAVMHVQWAEFSADGRWLAVGNSITKDSVTVKLYDAKTWAEVKSWEVPSMKPLRTLAFTPDGAKLQCLCSDRGVTIDIQSGSQTPMTNFPGPFYSEGTSVSLDQKYVLLVPSGPALRAGVPASLYTTDALTLVRQFEVPDTHLAISTAISENNRYIALGLRPQRMATDEPMVIVYELASGQEVARTKGLAANPSGIRLHHQAKTLAAVAAIPNNSSLQIWKFEPKTDVAKVEPPINPPVIGTPSELKEVVSDNVLGAEVVLTPDGKQVIYRQALTVFSRSIAKWDDAVKLGVKSPAVNIRGISSDSRYLLTISQTNSAMGLETHVWDLVEGKTASQHWSKTAYSGYQFSPDQSMIALWSTVSKIRAVRVVELKTGREIAGMDFESIYTVPRVAFSRDMTKLYAYAHDIRHELDLKTAAASKTFLPNAPTFSNYNYTSADGQHVLILSANPNAAIVYKVDPFEEVVRMPLPADQMAHRGAISPDGRFFALGVYERNDPKKRTVIVGDARTGKELARSKEYAAAVGQLSISRDGKVAGYVDGRIVVWQFQASGNEEVAKVEPVKPPMPEVKPPEPKASGPLFSLSPTGKEESISTFTVNSHFALSRDGGKILYADAQRNLKLRYFANWGQVRSLRGASPMDFSPDGKLALSFGMPANKTVVIELKNDNLRATLDQTPAGAFAFSPDGKLFAMGSRIANSVNGDLEVKAYDTTTWKETGSWTVPRAQYLSAVAFTADSSRIQCFYLNGGGLSIDVKSDDKRPIQVPSAGFYCTTSHDQKLVLLGNVTSGGKALLYATDPVGLVRQFDVPSTNRISCTALSEDNRVAVLGLQPSKQGEGKPMVLLFDCETGKEVARTKGLSINPSGLRLHIQAQVLAISATPIQQQPLMQIWKVEPLKPGTTKVEPMKPDPVKPPVVASEPGLKLLVNEAAVDVSGTIIAIFPDGSRVVYHAKGVNWASSPDKWSDTVKLDAKGGGYFSIREVSSDSRYVWLTSFQKDVYTSSAWDMVQRRLIDQFELDGPSAKTLISPDQTRAAAWGNLKKSAIVWDLETRREIRKLQLDPALIPSVVAFSSDSKKLFVLYHKHKTRHEIDLQTGEVRAEQDAPNIEAGWTSLDNQYALLRANGGQASVYKMQPFELVSNIELPPNHRAILSGAISADNRWVTIDVCPIGQPGPYKVVVADLMTGKQVAITSESYGLINHLSMSRNGRFAFLSNKQVVVYQFTEEKK